MKKQFESKEVRQMFKDLNTACELEIKFHRNYFYSLNSRHKLDDAQQGFIDGLNHIKDYIIKQYFDLIVRPTEEDEFISKSTIKNIDRSN